MKQLTDKLVKIRRRLIVQGFLGMFFVVLFYAFLISLVATVADRCFYLGGFVIYLPFVAFSVSVLGAAVYSLVRAHSLLFAAVRADDVLGLKERLSSAYVLEDKHTPASDALNADATAFLKTFSPSDVVPFRLSKLSYYTVVLLVVFALSHAYLPYLDLFKRQERIILAQKEKETAKRLSDTVVSLSERLKKEINESKDKKKTKVMNELVKELDKLATDLKSAKIDRKQAALKLSDLRNKVLERQDLVKSDMKNLSDLSRNTNQKFTKDLAKALAAGDPQSAQEQIDKLMDLLRSGKLSKQDMERLAKELSALSKAVKSLNPQLARKLALVAQNLQGMNMAEAMSQLDMTSEDMLSMGEAMAQMALMSGLSNDLEARKMALLADLSVLAGGRGGEGFGPGMGPKPGHGRGGSAQFDDKPVGFRDSKIESMKGKGKIISEMFFKGQPFSGEVTEEYKKAFVESKQTVEDSMTKEVIPAGYRKMVMDYFDSINPEKTGE